MGGHPVSWTFFDWPCGRDHLDALFGEPLIQRIAVICLVANQSTRSLIKESSVER
jgi:hypothetical protein